MRRNFLGLLTGLLIFGVSALLLVKNTRQRFVPSSGSYGYSSPAHEHMSGNWEMHASPLEATEEFNFQLRLAATYREFTPCFDPNGRRTGERALMYMMPPYVPQATWRIMWTQQSADFSESFQVESPSLSDVRYLETNVPETWKKCVTTNK